MSDSKVSIGRATISWLLERDNPSIRYFALRDLLDKGEDDPDTLNAKANIVTSKVVQKILSKQLQGGYWGDSEIPYQPKYKATYWQLMILAQLGADRSETRVAATCDYILRLQLKNGGFSACTRKGARAEYRRTKEKISAKGRPIPEFSTWAQVLIREAEYSCLTGNVAAALMRLGHRDDSRVKKALDWLLSIRRSDGGWLCPYWKAHIRDRHSCFHGTICALEAFSEVPDSRRSAELKRAIEDGVEFLLMHRLYKADHHGYRVINRNWLKSSFPSFYTYDILRGLSVVMKLGYTKDRRLKDSVRVLISKRRPDGTWLLDSSPNGRMHANIEQAGKPSKWITLNALRVLKRLGRTTNWN